MPVDLGPDGTHSDTQGSESDQLQTEQDESIDVFLSYNSDDKDEVITLDKALRGLGLKVWFDLEDAVAGPIAGQLEEAIRNAKAAVVVIGKHGNGQWQSQEIGGALRRRVADNHFKLIPVLLPGATMDDGFLGNYSAVEFKSTLNHMSEVRKLYKFISGNKLPSGAFEIHVEIEDASVTCLAVVPHNGNKGICNTIEASVKAVNEDLDTEIGFLHGFSDPMKFCMKIRAAEVIVADCTPGPDGLRDATVMYQLGLAQSIGKPVIIITSHSDDLAGILLSPDIVFCDRSQPDYEEKLRDELACRIKKIAKYAVFGLVAHDSHGIAAAYSDLAAARPMLFDRMQTIFSDGLQIHRYFREIDKHLYRLGKDIKELRIDLARAKREWTPTKAIDKTRETFERYLQSAFKGFNDTFEDDDNEFLCSELRRFASPTKTTTWEAFEYLKVRTKFGALDCINRSAISFETTGRRIAEYCEAFSDFSVAMDDVADSLKKKLDPQPQIERLSTRFAALDSSLRSVAESTNEMLASLLELISRRGA